MSKSNDLFDLIKSLSRSEKRYFRLFTSLHSKGETRKYEQLFDLIDRQKEYDEEAIRKKFGDDPIGRNLAAAKYYLYNTILKALHLYHAEDPVTAQINMLVHQADILYQRKLYEQFAKLLARAKELSIRHEQWHLTLGILGMEYRLLALEPDTSGVAARLEEHFGEIDHYLDMMRSHFHIWKIYARLVLTNLAHDEPRSSEQLDLHRRALDDIAGVDDSIALSAGARIYYYYSRCIVMRMAKEHEGALDSYLRLLPIIESSEHWRQPASVALVPTLYNICLMCLLTSNEELFLAYHKRLLETIDTEKDPQRDKFHISALLLLSDWYSTTGEFRDAMEVVEKIESELKEFDGKMFLGQMVHMYGAGFRAAFGIGDYARALDYLNRIVDHKPREEADTIYPIARILSLVVHYELGNHDLIEYQVQSTRRSIRSRDRISKMEQALLRFFSRVVRVASDAERRGLFLDLRSEISELATDPFENSITEKIDLQSWIESKLSGRPFADIVREGIHRRKESSRSQYQDS